MNDKISEILGYIIGLVLSVSLYSCLLMLTWNLLIPELFNFPKLTFFQSVGMHILSVILFKPTINLKEDE